MRKQGVVIASAQNDFGSLALESMQRIFSIIILFIRSITPFFLWVVWSLTMPYDLHKASNS